MRAAATSIKSIFALTLFATNNYDTNVAVAEIAEIAEITSVVTNETWPLTCVDNVWAPITTNNDDDFSCDVFCDYAFGAPVSVNILGSRVLIDDSANMVIMQYQVCACDYIAIGNSNDGAVNITFADGQKACKFDEKELVFPTSALDDKNDTVSCFDIGLNRDGSDCDDYCNDVVFKDFAPDTPVNSMSSTSSDPAYVSGCTCSWNNMEMDACMGSSGGAVGAMQFSEEFIVTAIGGSIMAACVMFL
jgi:hypothetical protein